MWVHASLGDWYTWLLIRAIAVKENKTVSDIINDAVVYYLEHRLGRIIIDKCRHCMLDEHKLECMVRCISSGSV